LIADVGWIFIAALLNGVTPGLEADGGHLIHGGRANKPAASWVSDRSAPPPVSRTRADALSGVVTAEERLA
jgi:hypothetical protein